VKRPVECLCLLYSSGAIFRVRWSGAAFGARPRHVRVRVVSRFSALQKTGQNIEMAANGILPANFHPPPPRSRRVWPTMEVLSWTCWPCAQMSV